MNLDKRVFKWTEKRKSYNFELHDEEQNAFKQGQQSLNKGLIAVKGLQAC